MATAAEHIIGPRGIRTGQPVAAHFRDFGRSVTYRVAGLPIALRVVASRPRGAPGGEFRRAYARRFWRPCRLGEMLELLTALFIWPAVLIGLSVAFLIKNGAIVARRDGRPIGHQLVDHLRLYGASGVLPPWYYIFELYRRPDAAHARSFIYRWESKAGILRMLKETYARQSVLNDKDEFDAHCREHQIAAATVLAVVRDGALEPRAHPIEMDSDLFVKPVSGRGGKGAERWDFAVDRYRNPRGIELDRDQLFERLLHASERQPLLIQARLRNHAALERLNNDALSTVRVLTCLDERGEPEVVGAATRMAIGNNRVVDNLHAGGIAAAVELETGVLGPASDLGADCSLGWVDAHPASNEPITDVALPMWDEVRSFAIRAHRSLGDRVLIGWDIAITPEGPVMVEGNGSPDLDIMQRFVRHGLMAGRLGVLLAFHVSQLGQ